MVDTAIIGTGPAGLSAALNLRLHEKELLWFGSLNNSEKVQKSEKIANYPGAGLISGADLNDAFRRHAQEMNLTVMDKRVTNIVQMGKNYALLADNEMFEARTLLLATGVVTGKGFPGEAEYLGSGVSYCATCDGFLYKGKSIAVFCASKRYEHEIEYLAKLADKVYLSTSYRDSEIDLPNVEIIPGIKEVYGQMKVTGIRLTDGSTRDVAALFCLRSAVSPATLLPGLLLEGPHIVVDRTQATNLKGCFAAGDCTGRPYQIAKAVGEGNVAAHAILDYLAEYEKQQASQ